MDMILPASVKAVLDEYDASNRGFHEHDLAQAIAEAARPAERRSDAERHAVWAEISAFNFMPSLGPDGSVWETYFAPSMTATRQDGTEIRSPDIAQADGSIIVYWGKRSGEVHHPILRARYADLVWDFTRTCQWRPPAPAYCFCQTGSRRLYRQHQSASLLQRSAGRGFCPASFVPSGLN